MVELTHHPLVVNDYLEWVQDPSRGALVVFEGVVRNEHKGRPVERIYYECHRPMCLKMMRRIESEILRRWPGLGFVLVHRVGMVELEEASVLVVTASVHRAEAYAASQLAMQRIKELLPIWKREYHPGNETSWVGIGS